MIYKTIQILSISMEGTYEFNDHLKSKSMLHGPTILNKLT